jgi:hypothetical protein
MDRQGKDIFHLRCENCGSIDITETADTSKVGPLSTEERRLLANYFRRYKGNVPQIEYSNFDQILDEARSESLTASGSVLS